MDEESIFAAVREKSSDAERAAFLDEACRGDVRLRAEVDELLLASDRADQFLESPPLDLTATTDSGPIAEHPGTVIGPYKLLQQIGEGGFGVVFMAEQQQPIRRRVALKVIKPGMDTRQIIARFEAERQALALMDHPNIARVFDAAATDSGRPYFVMELVHGVPITDYCNLQKLTPPERLRLFIDVCRAVQHAHQKGIIHRDLKPSNVMVTMHDDKPVAKIIDFGISKAVSYQLTEKTLFTGYGQMIGTPMYMSPEQAQLSGLDVDTRSDVYSLGVLMYELVTGTTPFDEATFKQVGFDEVRRMLREEEPPLPSSRVGTLKNDLLSTVADQRKIDPGRLSHSLRGEVDWIVMKCLEKDRNRRYESANALASDIERYLACEPVQACPPSATYRLRKLARRHKAAFLAGAAVIIASLVAIGSLVSGVLVLAASSKQSKVEQKQTQQALERETDSSYTQRIALAERELAAGNVGRAEELLGECPLDRRGWEWEFLKRQRYGNPPPLKHEDIVAKVAFSPDGRRIASVCMRGAIEIRDARTGESLHTLEPQTALVSGGLCRSMAYSRDGRYLAIARHDGVVRIWDASSGKRLHSLKAHNGPCWQIAFSPDSRTLASGGSDRSLRLWDVSTGQALQMFPAHPAAVKGVAFRPDGRSVLAACDDGTLKVWDRQTERETFSFRSELLTYPYSAWFSPDARRLAWSSLDGIIKIWDTTTGKLEIDQQSNTHQCRTVAFSPDGKRIALAGFDGTVRLLDSATGREMLTIYAHPSLVADVAFSSDGHRLASASYDQTVRIWEATPLAGDPQTPQCVTLTEHKQQVSGVAFSPDSCWLASASWDGTVKLWELSNESGRRTIRSGAAGGLAPRYTLRGHSANVIDVAFSPDNQTLASASWDNSVKLWDRLAPDGDSLAERATIRRPDRLSSIAFSRDGQMLAIGQQNGIAIFDPTTLKEIHPFKPTPAPVPGLAFGPDGRLFSAGASDPAIKVWDVANEKSIFDLRHYSNPNSTVAVSRDGQLIASAGRDQTAHVVKIWNAQSRKEVRSLKGHAGYVWKVAFSPTGRYLASGSWDSTVKIWDLDAPDSAEPITLRGHAGFIQSLAFSPDGRCLASASGYAGHGEVKLWDASLWENASGKTDVVSNTPVRGDH